MSLDSTGTGLHPRAPSLDKGTPGETRGRKATGPRRPPRRRTVAPPDATKDPTTAELPKGNMESSARTHHSSNLFPVEAAVPRSFLVTTAALAAVLACDNPNQPGAPSATAPAPAASVTTTAGFQVRDLGTFGGDESVTFSVNERSEVAGYATLPSGNARAFLWTEARGLRNLGTLGGANSFGVYVNDLGDVVGSSEVRRGSAVAKAFLWTKERGMRSLGTLGGRNSFAGSINNRREVTGNADLPNGTFHTYLWAPGRGMRDLGTLGGPNSLASEINDASQIVGTSDVTPDRFHAFLWSPQRGMEDLGSLGGGLSVAAGISQTGVVVGSSLTASGDVVAFIWTRARGMRSLGSLGGNFAEGHAINTHRRAVGISLVTSNRRFVPFLWTPENGMRALPRLGQGDFGDAWGVTEFGQIAGFTNLVPGGPVHAMLWSPTSGPLAAGEPSAETDAGELKVSAQDARAAVCAMGDRLGVRSRLGTYATRLCLAH
jgi:probable HAF family extracellular repeat protein